MTKGIREFYGISQSRLAEFIGISRSRLSMAENRRRDIPVKASLNLLKFFQAIDHSGIYKNEILKVHNNQQNERKEIAKTLLKRKRDELEYNEGMLKQMQQEQLRTMGVLNSLSILEKSASPLEISLIRVLEESALKIQRQTAPEKQLVLELSIEALEAEIAYLERI